MKTAGFLSEKETRLSFVLSNLYFNRSAIGRTIPRAVYSINRVGMLSLHFGVDTDLHTVFLVPQVCLVRKCSIPRFDTLPIAKTGYIIMKKFMLWPLSVLSQSSFYGKYNEFFYRYHFITKVEDLQAKCEKTADNLHFIHIITQNHSYQERANLWYQPPYTVLPQDGLHRWIFYAIIFMSFEPFAVSSRLYK